LGLNKAGALFKVEFAMLKPAEQVWLLAAVAKSDEAAFERLYLATRGTTYGVLLRILRQPQRAGEVMQETYVQVWQTAGQYDPALMTPLAWIVAMARNKAIDIVRSDATLTPELEPEVAGSETAAGAPRPELTDEVRRLLGCIGKLEDPDQRRLMLLAYFDGFSREQLAERLDRPMNTIRGWLRRSLGHIRECLGS
jgi:RNA polymerase sigma-70 factor (ECF subfamily)